MKKNLLFFGLFLLFSVVSCTSDDSTTTTEVTPNPSTGDWIPGQISLMNANVPIFNAPYPHAEGCDKDYIRLLSNSTATFFEHEPGTCAITETLQPWNRDGNQISLVIYNTPVTGTIILETATQLIIESDADQYTSLISILYPQFADYIDLLEGMKVQLVLNKK